MGANLGVGGQVVNETCVQCPFHGWLFDGETGQCVGIFSMIQTTTKSPWCSTQSNIVMISAARTLRSLSGSKEKSRTQNSVNIPLTKRMALCIFGFTLTLNASPTSCPLTVNNGPQNGRIVATLYTKLIATCKTFLKMVLTFSTLGMFTNIWSLNIKC